MAVVNANPVVQANKTLGYATGSSAISLAIPAPSDPNGDAMTIRVYSLPSWGTIRKADGTIVTSDTLLTPSDVAGLIYSVDPSKTGNAGSFTYGVSDGKGGFSYQVIGLNSAAPAAPAPPPPAAPAPVVTAPVTPPAPAATPAVNHAPTVQANKSVNVTAGQSVALQIPSPTDSDGDAMIIKVYEMPTAGTIRKADGTVVTNNMALSTADVAGLTYTGTSAVGAAGNFTWAASDNKGGFSYQTIKLGTTASSIPVVAPPAPAPLTPMVAQPTPPVPPVNHAPQAQANKSADAVIGQQVSLQISAPTDSDGDALTIKITALPTKGSVQLSTGVALTLGQTISAAQLASLIYRSPSATLGAMGGFGYQVDDGKGGLTQQTVSLNIVQPAAAPVVTPPPAPAPVNHAPVADADKGMSLAWGNSQALGIHAPTDSDGDALSITVTSVPTSGSLTLSDNTAVVKGQTLNATQLAGLKFTSPATGGTIGAATSFGSFAYAVNDGHGGTTAQSVSLFGNAVTTANPVTPPPASGSGLVLAREAYVARPGGLLNLGNMIQVGSGGTLPDKITIVGSDNNHYAGAETYNYGTLSAKSGVTYAGGFTLTFSLINGQYVTTPTASMTSTNGLTLSDFLFTASSQENRVQTFQVTTFNQAGAALEQRTLSVLTNSTYADATPGVASAGEVAQIAQSFIGKTWDVNGCWNLANTISLQAGASLDFDASGGAYQQNSGANGQWAVAYNAAGGVNNNWLSNLKAGDMLEWTPKNANFSHIAAVSKVVNGQVYIVDNAGAAPGTPGADAADVLIVETNLNAQTPYIDANSVLVFRLTGPTPGVTDLPATVAVGYNNDVQIGQTVAASTLFAASDPDNNPIQAYKVRDASAGGGSFYLNGAQQADGQWISIAANQLSSLTYKGGSARSVDTIEVQANDGMGWSAIASGRAITLGSQTIDDNSNTPTSLGTLSASKTSLTATDVLGRNDIQDFYSFTLATAATVTLSLSDLAADCRLDIYGPAGSGFSTSSGKGGTQSESITSNLAAGTYLVRAAYETGGPQTNVTNYDLAVSLVPPPPPNNLIAGG